MKEKGTVLVLAMVVLVMILFLAGIFLQLTLINIMHIYRGEEREKAFWIAKAGISQMLHNLREYYNLYEEYTEEKEFAGGKYKVGAATLIGRGYHNTLVVSVGEYGNAKYSFAAEVSMNTPTDYLLFSDLRIRQKFYRNILGGPVHVNGDILIGRDWGNEAFMKSDKEYGPVIEASGKVYSSRTLKADGSEWEAYVVIGEGKIPVPWVYDFNNYTRYYYITPPGVAGGPAGWPGITYPYWNVNAVPYDPNKYGSQLVVRKTRPDGTEYTYNLLDDKDTGGREIKVPTTDIISYNTFRSAIDPDWHITFSNPRGEIANITNESLYGTESYGDYGGGIGIGTGAHREKISDNVVFGLNGVEISIPSDRDINYIKYILLRLKATPIHFKGPVGSCQGMDNCYIIDRKNRKFKLQFPMYIDKFLFKYPPGFWGAPSNSYWRGRRIQGNLAGDYPGLGMGASNGQPNQVFTLPSEYVESTGIVNDRAVHPVRVFVGYRPAVEWIQAENDDFYAKDASGKDLYDSNSMIFKVEDYLLGKIRFGDGVKGAIPPNGAPIWIIFSHDFNVSNGIEAWIHEKVKAVKLDLGTINEDNAPRPPKYKDSEVPIDKKKYGVIFSEVPLVVWGVPKVPVTIVCMDDVYVGPINSTYLNPNNIDEWWKPIWVTQPEDASSLNPVGIITKKILFCDHTLAPTYPSQIFQNNTFVPDYNSGKNYLLNKVCLYYSWIFDPLQVSWYGDRFGLFGIGGSNYGWIDSYSGFCDTTSTPKIIGSVYYCADKDLIKETASKKLTDFYYTSSAIRSPAYANSFRRNPPPHIPKMVYITSYRLLQSVNRAENFLSELKNYLESPDYEEKTYSAKFSETITKLLNALEGVEEE